MNALLLLFAMTAQASAPATTPSHLRPRGVAMRHEGTPESRLALQRYGACLARNSPGVAVDTLRSDFTARAYHNRLNRLMSANDGCFRRSGYRMAFSTPLITAALAEAVLAGEGTPLNVRLARAAMRAPVTPFNASDRVAVCVVRSVPDQAAALLTSEVGSAAEEAAAAAVVPGLDACLHSVGLRAQFTTAGLRAALAPAAFRSVDAATAASANLAVRN